MALLFHQGFQALVEREWLEFGHKFADRCGHAINSDDPNEKSPVFLQWLDCVYQLIRKFPCAFEFNEAFLVSVMSTVLALGWLCGFILILPIILSKLWITLRKQFRQSHLFLIYDVRSGGINQFK